MKMRRNIGPEEIKELICRLAQEVTGIYIIGTRSNMGVIRSIWKGDLTGPVRSSQYFLLVFIADINKVNATEMREAIEGNEDVRGVFTALVLSESEYLSLCRVNNRFAVLAEETGIKLWEPDFKREMGMEKNIEKSDLIKERGLGFKRSRVFLNGSRIYKEMYQYEITLFLLHQALEQCLLSYWRESTGYWMETHNIDRLLKYCVWLNRELDVFDRTKLEEVRQLKILKASYIEARYGERMHILKADLESICDKIEQICTICERVMEM